jgi:hypothetical protein
VRNVSIDVIFTVGLLPAGWFFVCFSLARGCGLVAIL